jgi:hypothetical protein
MSKFVCGTCGKEHGTLPMDLAYRKPLDYFKIPEAQRAKRIWINDDLCVIDEEMFLIRGVLPLPVHNGGNVEDEFRWGVWVEVEEASFRRYLEVWDVADPSEEPPFPCRLSAVLPGYPDTDTLEADAQLCGPNDRPLIYLRAEDHPLVREQKSGITMARVHDILESAMPRLFPRAGER